MSVEIRKGKEEDLQEVLELIKELAVYERSPEEVEVSLNEMANWGFGKDKVFDFFVVEKEGVIVAMALYYHKYSTWKGKCLFLEDIIVTENERRNGYGKMLFNEVAKVAKKEQVRRMEWQVLEWNETAIRFYQKYMSNFDEEWINCKLTYDQIQKLRIY
jgi:N-acetylglutamate synthase-like GNAT family acetyltransferase